MSNNLASKIVDMVSKETMTKEQKVDLRQMMADNSDGTEVMTWVRHFDENQMKDLLIMSGHTIVEINKYLRKIDEIVENEIKPLKAKVKALQSQSQTYSRFAEIGGEEHVNDLVYKFVDVTNKKVSIRSWDDVEIALRDANALELNQINFSQFSINDNND